MDAEVQNQSVEELKVYDEIDVQFKSVFLDILATLMNIMKLVHQAGKLYWS